MDVVPCRPKIFGFNQNKIGRIINLFHFEINAIFNEIKAINYDFLHAHWSYEFATASLKLDKNALITVHDNPYEIIKFTSTIKEKIYRFGRLLMAEYNIRKASNITTVSNYMLPFLNKRVKSEANVVPNPISIRYDINQVIKIIHNKKTKLKTPKIIMINNGD